MSPIFLLKFLLLLSGPHTTSFPDMNRVGSVGKEIVGIMTHLDNPDKDGNGEVNVLHVILELGFTKILFTILLLFFYLIGC